MKIRVSSALQIQRATVTLDRPTEWEQGVSRYGVRRTGGPLVAAQWERHEFTASQERLRSAELVFVNQGAGDYAVEVLPQPVRDRLFQPMPLARQWISRPPEFRLDSVPVPTSYDERWYRNGALMATRRFHGPHLVGYVTVYADLDLALVEMFFHNGVPRSSDLFFSRLELPAALHVEHAWPEPGIDGPVLVAPRSDGKMNLLERKGRREFRFVVHDGTQRSLARELTDFGDVAAQVDGECGPQRITMPDLSSRATMIAARVASDLSALDNAIVYGTQIGSGASIGKPGGRIGFKPLWGGRHGGVTGGGYRYQFEGWQFRVAALQDSLPELATRGMMVGNRQPGFILTAEGRPVDADGFLGWDVSASDSRFERGPNNAQDFKDGTFGFAQAPLVCDPAEFPATEWDALSTYSQNDPFDPQDWQHFDRFYMPRGALAELAAAPLAMLDLRLAAEQWRMSILTGGFNSECSAVGLNPGRGTRFGRAEGHLFACVAWAWRFMSVRERARWGGLLWSYATTLCNAQMPNGRFQAMFNKQNQDPANPAYVPLGKGAYAISKTTEEALLVNSLQAIHGLAMLPASFQVRIRQAIVRWVEHGLWRYAWRSGDIQTPADYVCVRGAEPLESWWTLPNAAGFYGYDSTEIGTAIGYALLWTDTSADVDACARAYCGDATSLAQAKAWLLAQPSYDKLMMDDRLPLLAALERPRTP
jgi:hypothetical protein